MAEIIYSSAGVYATEIDLSQPTPATPVGTPAGVIGTADRGPAFVPITVGNYQSFVLAFGNADGSKFGPLAVNQFLKNAQALTYLRVLGVGDGKKRSDTNGQVTNSGFVVGNQQVQDNGNIGSSVYASSVGDNPLGRTHFLGCFMSESAGSTIFSEAGITLNISGAVPIIRGVLMAASGVIPMLSGNWIAQGSSKPSDTGMFRVDGSQGNLQGGLTGSVDLSEQQFTLLLNGHKSSDGWKNVHTCSFETTSGQYFAHVLNTDPLKIEEAGHFLYAHYDIDTSRAVITGSGILTGAVDFSKGRSGTHEPVAFLTTGSISRNNADTYAPNYENFRDRFTSPVTPYITSQVYGASPYNLFRVHSVDDGAYASTLFKINIRNIKPSTDASGYGTFSLVVRDFNDSDYDVVPLEAYNGLSLDPSSDRYIGRMIGDQRLYFDFDQASSSQKLVVAGDYPVRSNYIRVELSDALKNGNVPNTALPVGFRGISHLVTSGSHPLTSPSTGFVERTNSAGGLGVTPMIQPQSLNTLKRAVQPPITFRQSVAVGEGLAKRSKAGLSWGVQFETMTSLSTPNALKPTDPSIASFAKFFPSFHPTSFNFSVGNNTGVSDSEGTVLDADVFNNNIFSLERIKLRTGSVSYDGVTVADIDHWASASYVRDGDITVDTTLKTRAFKVDDLKAQGNRAYLTFTTIAQGGFNGLNVFNRDSADLLNASAKREMDDSLNQGGVDGSTVAAYRKAVDIMGTKSDVEINLLAIPGLRHTSVTDYTIDAVESRFDSMYIMDIEERDELDSVVTSSIGAKVNVTNTVNAFLGRALDTSFAGAYFPDVVIKEPTNHTNVRVPPSTVVLGAFAQNDAIGYPWFAPAGFSRGTLGDVQQTSVQFNKANLDDIYDADINPITEPVPGAGLMVWGQKTLMANASALDRVNVRRLLIYIRRKVRDVSNQMLFEPNRQETLDKFTSLVQPILQTIQERSGVDRYRVIIDATTTTQTDIENNTLRGKIFIQPTRTAEFVALDFVVSNAGNFANV
jgi:hypothetical protein